MCYRLQCSGRTYAGKIKNLRVVCNPHSSSSETSIIVLLGPEPTQTMLNSGRLCNPAWLLMFVQSVDWERLGVSWFPSRIRGQGFARPRTSMLSKSARFNEVGNTYFVGDVAPRTHHTAYSTPTEVTWLGRLVGLMGSILVAKMSEDSIFTHWQTAILP